jgi:hypothetical protein
VRQVVHWAFALPDVGQRYSLAAFTIDDPSSPSDLMVQYDPIGDAPPLRVEITHDRPAFGGGNRSSKLSNGTPLYFSNLGGTVTTYFELHGDTYTLILLTGTDSASNEALLIATANTIVARS